jgi:hypothetical protein
LTAGFNRPAAYRLVEFRYALRWNAVPEVAMACSSVVVIVNSPFAMMAVGQTIILDAAGVTSFTNHEVSL